MNYKIKSFRRLRPDAMTRRRLLEELELLVSCGLGIEVIAGRASAIARDLLNAHSGSIFWRDSENQPAGFYHDCAPAELKELFITQFDELFSGTDQFNMVTVTQMIGPSIGRLISEDGRAGYLSCNVYKYLCKPLGHEHALDIRIENDKECRAVLMLWDKAQRPFGSKDVEAVTAVQQILANAIKPPKTDMEWRKVTSKAGHFITNAKGTQLLVINDEAEHLLKDAHLLRDSLRVTKASTEAPLVAQQLAEILAKGGDAELHLPIASGRLVLSASRSYNIALDEGAADLMFVSIEQQVPVDLEIIQYVCALPLTYLQKQIAAFAMQGGQRIDAGSRYDISAVALKKHLRAIFDATGTSTWNELTNLEAYTLEA